MLIKQLIREILELQLIISNTYVHCCAMCEIELI